MFIPMSIHGDAHDPTLRHPGPSTRHRLNPGAPADNLVSIPSRSGRRSIAVRRISIPDRRACLPPLQPLAITRRSLDEWPKAGSDDVGEWPNPTTPGANKPGSARPGEGLHLDLSTLRSEGRKDQIAFFEKECSKVADHVYINPRDGHLNRRSFHQQSAH